MQRQHEIFKNLHTLEPVQADKNCSHGNLKLHLTVQYILYVPCAAFSLEGRTLDLSSRERVSVALPDLVMLTTSLSSDSSTK